MLDSNNNNINLGFSAVAVLVRHFQYEGVHSWESTQWRLRLQRLLLPPLEEENYIIFRPFYLASASVEGYHRA